MRRMEWAVTDLPQPLSPTIPKTSPGRMDQINAFHCTDDALIQGEGHVQVFDFQQQIIIQEQLPF